MGVINNDLEGIGSNVAFGERGTRIKEEDGSLVVRNTQDTKYATLRVGTPSMPHDAVTLEYLENRSHVTVMGGMLGNNPPTNAIRGSIYIVLEATHKFKERRLYKWTGSGWEKLKMFNDMRMVVSNSILEGVDLYEADHVYIWKHGDKLWEDGGVLKGVSKIEKAYCASVDFTKRLIKIGDVIQSKGVITKITILVKQPFNGSSLLTLGDAVHKKQLVSKEDNIDLSEVAVYTIPLYHKYVSPTQVFAYLTTTGSTQGKLEIVINWSKT